MWKKSGLVGVEAPSMSVIPKDVSISWMYCEQSMVRPPLGCE